jgi:hypothetical protein
MTMLQRTLRQITSAGLAIALLGGAAPLDAASDTAMDKMPMDKMVSGAASKSDHEALAAEYDRQAAEARAASEMHARMADNYKRASGAGAGKGSGTAVAALVKHCEDLAQR